MQPKTVKFPGRVLHLTEDKQLLESQLYGGKDLQYDPSRKLIDNISTDELTPGWVCYYYDETLARYCLVGLRGGVVERDAIKNGGFGVIVSGRSKHREDLRAELPEHRAADDDRLRRARSRAPRRGDPHLGVHQGARSDQRRRRRVRRALQLQQGAPRRRGVASGAADAGAADDAVREDHRPARHRRRQDGQAG